MKRFVNVVAFPLMVRGDKSGESGVLFAEKDSVVLDVCGVVWWFWSITWWRRTFFHFILQ